MFETTSRRNFLKSMTAVSVATALGSRIDLTFADEKCSDVTVGMWGGDYQRLFDTYVTHSMVDAGKGGAIYAVADANTRVTKMRAELARRRGSIDVTCFSETDMAEMNRIGALEPLEIAQVPNAANTFAQLRTGYSIPQLYSGLVIVYNPDIVKEPPKSFKDCLDKKYQGQVGFSDIIWSQTGVAAALAAGDASGNLGSAPAFLTQLKDNKPKVFPSHEMVAAALKSGEIGITWMWKARAVQWNKSGIKVEYVLPAEGLIPGVFQAGVAKNSTNKKCAFEYLNALLEPKAQVSFAESFGYAPTVTNSGISTELLAQVGFSEDQLNNMIKIDYAKQNEDKPQFLEFWAKSFKAGL